MTTQNTKSKLGAVPSPERAPSEALCSYLDYLSTAHEKFVASVTETRDRASRVNETLLGALLESQREALETSKRIAANPGDYSANVKAMMEAATAAQERSMSLAKSLFQEQADVAAEFRKMFDGAMKSSNDISETARKLSAFWPKVA